MQVHDELVLEVPDAEFAAVRRALPELTGSVVQLSVPLLVEVGAGPNWDQAHWITMRPRAAWPDSTAPRAPT